MKFDRIKINVELTITNETAEQCAFILSMWLKEDRRRDITLIEKKDDGYMPYSVVNLKYQEKEEVKS